MPTPKSDSPAISPLENEMVYVASVLGLTRANRNAISEPANIAIELNAGTMPAMPSPVAEGTNRR